MDERFQLAVIVVVAAAVVVRYGFLTYVRQVPVANVWQPGAERGQINRAGRDALNGSGPSTSASCMMKGVVFYSGSIPIMNKSYYSTFTALALAVSCILLRNKHHQNH